MPHSSKNHDYLRASRSTMSSTSSSLERELGGLLINSKGSQYGYREDSREPRKTSRLDDEYHTITPDTSLSSRGSKYGPGEPIITYGREPSKDERRSKTMDDRYYPSSFRDPEPKGKTLSPRRDEDSYYKKSSSSKRNDDGYSKKKSSSRKDGRRPEKESSYY